MGDPVTIAFGSDSENIDANIYLHSEGDNAFNLVGRFLHDIEKEIPADTRFDDPSYLAARFVYWYGRSFDRGLDFTQIGIVPAPYREKAILVTCRDKSRPIISKRP